MLNILSQEKETGRRYFDITDDGFKAIKAAMLMNKV